MQGVDEFCRAHPKLEHLHLNDNNGLPFQLKGDWVLNKLHFSLQLQLSQER